MGSVAAPTPLGPAQKAFAAIRQRLTRLDPSVGVFNSFDGKFSDNPRAIYEEMLRRSLLNRHIWISSGEREAPPGVETAELGTQDYLKALGRAGVVISNCAMPRYLARKRATYLQTWHGTPLKMIGFDNPHRDPRSANFRRAMRDYRQWDLLVSQNAFSTEIFRRAFRFDGEILEVGYPRNDVLNSPQAAEIRERVRRDLGVAPDKKVILYAPTYRDDDRSDSVGRYMQSIMLDVDEVERSLGDEFDLLVRLHYWVAPTSEIGASGYAIDVSHHADIRELYLAADVLVTDYSSAMFDFAITGKPILLFTYDLDRYRESLRGLYFDITEIAPGPLCSTTGELVDVLRDLDGAAGQFAPAYQRFRERFCYLDDGRASERVVDRLFADR